ncbi:MAG: dTDP-4-dehydrorhamnose 3,5-epimerase [Xanthomonadales bacterium]|nr:dTDP-4-dehydrorhamnose 3,5-epimerase [Xanthomonadales bacterium]
MKTLEERLGGVQLLEPTVFGDDRGWFMESYNAARFADLGLPTNFVQSNLSRSRRGVLRGLHYQWPNPQGKLVQVVEGEVFDVAVDIRQGSPTFGQWYGANLSAANRRQMYVPEGFAHGFAVLSDWATFSYLCTSLYHQPSDRGVRWDDPAIGIDWPIEAPSLSEKDVRAALLAEVPPELLPR